jgi:transcription-repair coupling factor (superfamily II helicase)
MTPATGSAIPLLSQPISGTPQSINLNELHGCGLAMLLVQQAQLKQQPLVVITADIHQAELLKDEIRFFYSSQHENILSFPDWETLPYDVFSPHQDIISERLTTLYRLPAIKPGQILILPVATLLQRLCPRSFIQQHVLLLDKGQKLNINDFRHNLERGGYVCVSQVMAHGEFAIRGSIIDVYPSGHELPFRIDLFDDEIDSIRRFDPESQRSLDNIDSIHILPAREFPFSKDAITAFRSRYRETIDGDPMRSLVYEQISQGIMPGGIEYYLPLFFDQTECLFDYLPRNTLFIRTDALNEQIDQYWLDINQRYEQRRHDVQRPLLPPQKLCLTTQEVQDRLIKYQTVLLAKESSVYTQLELMNRFNFALPPMLLLEPRTQQPLSPLVNYLASYSGRVLFVAESTGRREALLELLREQKIQPRIYTDWQAFLQSNEKLGVMVAPLERGLQLTHPELSIIAEPQIFGERVQQRRRRQSRTRDADAIISNLADLHIGSPVVHEEHGVGRYQGLIKLEINGTETEFLSIEYAGGDKLYVPVSALNLISRYTGASEENAPLHKLGGEVWKKIKRKAAEKIRDVAAEILAIHAQRAAKQGQPCVINREEYNRFANAFQFEETEDQKRAINDVLTDLSSPVSMDRVVCGDVGFGKTEVAMRAAFVVANSGKQVAILVPTTLLAQQHYQNFRDRFADWPLRIEGLSRFKSKKQQDEIISETQTGKVDIIIGTHKLLQGDMRFKDLGLLIIDEEHRFGVQHKEQFKKLRAEVDILTMTATPIPRTLNMSLSGLRDLSIIATPPVQRLAIKTFVSEWNDAQIQEACLREIKRGGQVYFLHNDVKTIAKTCEQIAALVPEARIEFAHGQMPERDLERVMLDFYHQRFNVLVCTTIIESGIDVPTANTIIINRADKLGLAQLHQIRGRVGRSHHRAYAYLITPALTALSDDAKKRLDAIASLEELGVGFTLATHDLEIRGAGELLGESQSGQINEIGFTMYSELLDRAVKSLKSGKKVDLDEPLNKGTEIDIGVPAFFPDDYITDVHSRLMLYKRIASTQSQSDLDKIRVELIDRFGLLPDQAKNLFSVTMLKLITQPVGVKKIDASDKHIRIIFLPNANINPANLIELIQNKTSLYKFNGKDTLHIMKKTNNHEERFATIKQTIQYLSLSEAA